MDIEPAPFWEYQWLCGAPQKNPKKYLLLAWNNDIE